MTGGPATPKRRGRPTGQAAPGAAKARKLDAAQGPAALETMSTPWECAIAALKPDGFRGQLPCREEEQARIAAHLRTAVRQGGSMQVLYVSGMPGTGKTASVLEAIRQMRCSPALPRFALAHINAMRLNSPGAVFREIYGQLPREAPGRCALHAAHGELLSFFGTRRAEDPVVLLLIDEIDHLVTSNQAVLYKLFDWLALPSPRLAVVAISNTMDLPERLLPRVASRFGIVRVDFEPYSRDQIHRILLERLQLQGAVASFTPTSLKLCAARVAAGSGDIRKALQLCRRAVEVRSTRGQEAGPVDLAHLDVAEKDLLHANPAARAISGLAPKARRLLVAVLVELRKQDADVVPIGAVTARYAKLQAALATDGPRGAAAAVSRVSAPLEPEDPEDEVAYLVTRLEAMALLLRQGKPLRSGGPQGAMPGLALALGAGLDAEDLAVALEAVEDDEGILELLRAERP